MAFFVEQPHPLMEQIVEIEWATKEPQFFNDPATDAHGQSKRFKVLDLRGGMVNLQRDVSTGTRGPGPFPSAWVSLTAIVALRRIV